MKKLLLGSLTLIAFSLAILVFQVSCKKDAVAQTNPPYTLPPATTTTLGGVMVDGTTIKVDGTGKISATIPTPQQPLNVILFVKESASGTFEFWLANMDGSNQRKINITLPAGITLRDEAQISPDGTKLIFNANDTNAGYHSLYSVALTGGTPVKLLNGATTERIHLSGVY